MSICVYRRRTGRSAIAIGAALLVAVLIQPAGAGASNVGGGVLTGDVAFAPGKLIPRAINPNNPTVTEPCAQTSFTLTGSTLSASLVLNSAFTGHFGEIVISGYGGAGCETALGGSGSLTLTDVRGTGPTNSKIECANPATGTTLRGGYTRTATDVEAVLGGTCIINGPPGFSAPVLFSFHGQFEPEPGQGLTAPVSQAKFQGVFAVEPA